jgi:hypothetical protein
MHLQFPSGVHVPQLLPSFKAVKAKWKEIIASTMTLSTIAILGIPAAEWLITDILEYIFANEYLVSLCSEGLELVEVIIKLDAFPVAGGNCFLMTLTLGNFGNACKDSWLHFLAAIAACNDKDYDIVAQVVKNNFAIIDLLTAAGEIFIKALQKTVKIVFSIGGDDALLRLITGMDPSGSKWCCFYCFWQRKLPAGIDQCKEKRNTATACKMAETQQGGHQRFPLLKKLPWSAYKMCILHAMMSMGRLFCHFFFNWLVLLEREGKNLWDTAAKLFKLLHITVDITKPPANGTWSIKGE